MKLIKFIAVAAILIPTLLTAQDTRRDRPEGWDGLVPGGRFMDLFKPMKPISPLTSDCWGLDAVKPRDISNGIEDPKWSYWGGNLIPTEEGQFHLFVCRWKESSLRGHMQWPQSEIVQAVADNSAGPFEVLRVLGKGHNPEAYKLPDGSFMVYRINGFYWSDSLDGPWLPGRYRFDRRKRKIVEGLSNLSFARREDGSFLMVCRGGGIWVGDGAGTWHQVSNGSVYPDVEGAFEDPVLWKDEVQYHMIVNDWLGRIAYYLRSPNGIDWKVDAGEAYLPGIARYSDGTLNNWYKFERIKILQDRYGRAIQANFAVIDSSKWDDKGSDNHSSKNIAIPLTRPLRTRILSDSDINHSNGEIRLLIESEPGKKFPDDLKLDSLRLGAPESVDFGKGASLLRVDNEGDSAVLVFKSSEIELREDNFTLKLLGKDRLEELVFSYAAIPGRNERKFLLSSEGAKIRRVEGRKVLTFYAENFGVEASGEGRIEINLTIGRKNLTLNQTIASIKPGTGKTIRIPLEGSATGTLKRLRIRFEGQRTPLWEE